MIKFVLTTVSITEIASMDFAFVNQGSQENTAIKKLALMIAMDMEDASTECAFAIRVGNPPIVARDM